MSIRRHLLDLRPRNVDAVFLVFAARHDDRARRLARVCPFQLGDPVPGQVLAPSPQCYLLRAVALVCVASGTGPPVVLCSAHASIFAIANGTLGLKRPAWTAYSDSASRLTRCNTVGARLRPRGLVKRRVP